MKTITQMILLLVLTSVMLSCAGKPVGEDSEFGDESSDSMSTDDGGSEDFADDSSDSSDKKKSDDSGGDELADSGDDLDSLDKDLDKEQKLAEGTENNKDQDPLVEEAKKDDKSKDPQAEADVKSLGDQKDQAPVVTEETKDPLLDTPPQDTAPAITETTPPPEPTPTTQESKMSSARNEITNIKFEGNEGGGSIIIEGSQPLDFTTRMNGQSNQFVVEINGAHLPDKLKRPFITKDFPSSVGSIDAYQTPGSDSVKIVVQLRDGEGEPTSHAEGNSIIVVPPGANAGEQKTASSDDGKGSDEGVFSSQSGGGILSSRNLEQFLSGNMKYYGKKISIEMRDIEVRNAINLIAEESGANLVMSEGVTGNISLKLKNVPWDQALVLILKAKKLGYSRQGNVLRISPMSEIKAEEEEAMKLVDSRRKIDPLKVQMIPINYAKISDLKDQLKGVLSERGNIVADGRTSSLILTETEEILDRAKKIISSLDIAPAQVLIEGKLVEARESFNKRLGINWDVAGTALNLGDGANGPINMTPAVSVRPGNAYGGAFGFNITLGTLDVLGDLNAVLMLEEQEENVRVISSPRIVTLHNEKAEIKQEAEVPVTASSNLKDGTKTTKMEKIEMMLSVTPAVANNGVVQMDVTLSRGFFGGVQADGNVSKHKREAKTKVMVKSGQTAVIGGIYQNDMSQLENGVPFLKQIPIIGALFRDHNYHKDKTELLLFLTPRILSQAGSPIVAQDINDMGGNKDEGDSQLE